MKRLFTHTAVAAFAALLLCAACSSSADDDTPQQPQAAPTPLAEQTAAEETLSLTDVEGKHIYAVVTNPTETLVSLERLRTITATSGITEAATGAASSALLSTAAPAADAATVAPRYFEPPVPRRNAFSAANASAADTAPAARAAADGVTAPAKLENPTVGETTMQLYVDWDASISTFGKKQATLRAMGEHCYVWVVDEYYTESEVSATAPTDKVNSTIAALFAEKFGEEPETIFYNDAPYSTMAEWSATGSKVNIVLYDIGKDYNLPSFLTKGVMGYFYDKDYYVPVASGDLRYSNQGKYFYVDTYYAVKLTDTTLSTLAHEFQHMIGFGVDKSADGEETQTWYHELLALLAEDALFEYLQIPEESSPRYRLASFNADYALSGIEYNTAEGSLSYATLYAFGAWCARNFGGAAFIKELARNNSANIASVVNAVNACNGTAYTMTDLLRLYTQALIDRASPYTLNKAAQQSFRYESSDAVYGYPLAAIDLWSDEFAWTTRDYTADQLLNTFSSDGSAYCAPALFNPAAVTLAIRPYGFVLYKLGTAQAADVSVTFSAGSAAEQCYLLALPR